MKLRLHQISVPYDKDTDHELKKELHLRLGPHSELVKSFEVVRRSIDARHRFVKILYSLDVDFGDNEVQIAGTANPKQREYLRVESGKEKLSTRPVIVGGGPAGLFASLLLAEHGFEPLLLERGGDVKKRIGDNRKFLIERTAHPECNILFGLGGAGTFSDGKLTTGISHKWLPAVLEILRDCGAPEDILVSAKPHIGTDVLVRVVRNLVDRIERAGGTVKTSTRVDEIEIKEGRLRAIVLTGEKIDAEVAVLAIGHSARDTLRMLLGKGVEIEPKPFQIGVRVEHPQRWLDEALYGEAAGHASLGAAYYKLTAKVGATPVFSFCMCPGGETIPTVNEAGHLALNGMSRRARNSPFSSSGIVVTLRPPEYGGYDLESCMAFQRAVESACFEAGGSDYTAPGQRLIDFAADERSKGQLPKASYPLGIEAVLLSGVLPDTIASPIRGALEIFNRKLPGYLHPEAMVLAPESRASSPVRIPRDPQTRQSKSVKGLYPAGEGAGYAGGIMSSALDGLDAAAKIIEKHSFKN